MQRRTLLTAGLLASGSALLSACSGIERRAFHGWETVLDGSTLDGWNQVGKGNWSIDRGIVVGNVGTGKEAGFLVSPKTYRNFMLRAEIWTDEIANTGVFIRCTDPKTITSSTAYEVNIFDQRPDPSYGTGAIVNVAKAATQLKAANQWNLLEITARGGYFTVTLNGVRTVDKAHDAKLSNGLIALQSAGGYVQFRRVEIKTLS